MKINGPGSFNFLQTVNIGPCRGSRIISAKFPTNCKILNIYVLDNYIYASVLGNNIQNTIKVFRIFETYGIYKLPPDLKYILNINHKLDVYNIFEVTVLKNGIYKNLETMWNMPVESIWKEDLKTGYFQNIDTGLSINPGDNRIFNQLEFIKYSDEDSFNLTN